MSYNKNDIFFLIIIDNIGKLSICQSRGVVQQLDLKRFWLAWAVCRLYYPSAASFSPDTSRWNLSYFRRLFLFSLLETLFPKIPRLNMYRTGTDRYRPYLKTYLFFGNNFFRSDLPIVMKTDVAWHLWQCMRNGIKRVKNYFGPRLNKNFWSTLQ
jgi:hypothetical protein